MVKETYLLGPLIFVLVGYLVVMSPSTHRKPHPWAQGFKGVAQPSRREPQSTFVWNALAPLADDVSFDISRRDLSKQTDLVDNWEEAPKSYLLHEARPSPENITYVKWIYQLVLFISGALLMKLSVVPLF